METRGKQEEGADDNLSKAASSHRLGLLTASLPGPCGGVSWTSVVPATLGWESLACGLPRTVGTWGDIFIFTIFHVFNGNGKPIAIPSILLLRSSLSHRTGLFYWLLGCEFLGVPLGTLLFGKVVALQKTKMGCNAVKAMLILGKHNTCFIEKFQKEQL